MAAPPGGSARSGPTDQSQGTPGQKIARAARAFEKRRTKRGREWVAVLLNEDTIVIVLHGSLTAAEKALARSPAGAAQVRERHRRLFANASAPLFREIESLTGMEVRDTTAEIGPTTGSVVHLFTTDTAGENFMPAPVGRPGFGRPDPVRRAGTKVAPAEKPTNPDE